MGLNLIVKLVAGVYLRKREAILSPSLKYLYENTPTLLFQAADEAERLNVRRHFPTAPGENK